MSFEIIRARGTLPGRAAAVRADIDVDVSGQLMGRAIAGLGESIANLGIKYDIMEGKAQADLAERDARLSMVDLLNNLRMEDDVSKWDALITSHEQRVSALTPKNKSGARQYNTSIGRLTPIWAKGLSDLKADKLEENMLGASIQKVNSLLDSATIDNMELVIQRVKTELEVRDRLSPSTTRATTEIAKAKVEHDVQLSIAKKAALRIPQTMLESIEGDKIPGFDKLTPDDILRIRNMANSAMVQAEMGIKKRDDEISMGLMGLLINKLDPEKPQLTFDAILNAGLSIDGMDEWFTKLRVFDGYSRTKLEEAFQDRGAVLADIYQKVEDNKITDKQIRDTVGKGLSPGRAEAIIEDREVWQTHEYKETDQIFKRIFGWQPDLGFKDNVSAFMYEKTLREWGRQVKEEKLTGEDIIDAGRAIARPYFIERLKSVLSYQEEDIPRIVELALGEPEEIEKTEKEEEAKEALPDTFTPSRAKALADEFMGKLPKLELPQPKKKAEPKAETEPKTLSDFEARVSALKAEDMEKAREYYDKWIGKWRK